MRITRREKKFWEQHLSCVRHITLAPRVRAWCGCT